MRTILRILSYCLIACALIAFCIGFSGEALMFGLFGLFALILGLTK